jgi:hypothetical protein
MSRAASPGPGKTPPVVVVGIDVVDDVVVVPVVVDDHGGGSVFGVGLSLTPHADCRISEENTHTNAMAVQASAEGDAGIFITVSDVRNRRDQAGERSPTMLRNLQGVNVY